MIIAGTAHRAPYSCSAGESPATIQYARRVGKPVSNLWISWIKYK